METREQLESRHARELSNLELQEAILDRLPKNHKVDVNVPKTTVTLLESDPNRWLDFARDIDDQPRELFEISPCVYVTLEDIQLGRVATRPGTLNPNEPQGSIVLRRLPSGQLHLFWRGQTLTYTVQVKPSQLPGNTFGYKRDKWIPGSISSKISNRGSGAIGILYRLSPVELFAELVAENLT